MWYCFSPLFWITNAMKSYVGILSSISIHCQKLYLHTFKNKAKSLKDDSSHYARISNSSINVDLHMLHNNQKKKKFKLYRPLHVLVLLC